MLKKIGVILKKLVFAFGLLYGINLFLNNIDIFIPINIVTLAISTCLGVPGVLALFALFFIID